MKHTTLILATLALLTIGLSSVNAGSITTLYNTGVNASGTPLPDSTVGDPHYALVSVPGGSTTLLVRTAAGGYPIPPYIGNDSLSAWIGPNNDHILDGPVGHYDYQTTFDLTGFNPATASISGGWSTDNGGIRILLNGVDTGNAPTSTTQYGIGFASFSMTSGFLPGINTLDFIVNNDDGPTALRVEMTGSADASDTPEPASVTLLAFGIVGIAGYSRRRRKLAATQA
jgi:hypothetical protein